MPGPRARFGILRTVLLSFGGPVTDVLHTFRTRIEVCESHGGASVPYAQRQTRFECRRRLDASGNGSL